MTKAIELIYGWMDTFFLSIKTNTSETADNNPDARNTRLYERYCSFMNLLQKTITTKRIRLPESRE